MMHSAQEIFSPRFWLLDPPPSYANVWLFKTNIVGGHGEYRSVQPRPSGVTLRLVTAGQWHLATGGQEFPVRPGDIFLTLPSAAVDFGQSDAATAWTWHELQFNGEAAESFVGEFGLSSDRPVITPKQPRSARRLFRLLYELMGRADRTPDQAMALLFRLIRACGQLPAASGEAAERSPGLLVRRAVTLLENDPSCHLNVAELAQHLGVDRTTLGRAFKRQTGNSPHHFISSYRMMKVHELLRHSTLSIGRIAAATGFRDEKYFINWFRKHTGQPPSRWRQTETDRL